MCGLDAEMTLQEWPDIRVAEAHRHALRMAAELPDADPARAPYLAEAARMQSEMDNRQ